MKKIKDRNNAEPKSQLSSCIETAYQRLTGYLWYQRNADLKKADNQETLQLLRRNLTITLEQLIRRLDAEYISISESLNEIYPNFVLTDGQEEENRFKFFEYSKNFFERYGLHFMMGKSMHVDNPITGETELWSVDRAFHDTTKITEYHGKEIKGVYLGTAAFVESENKFTDDAYKMHLRRMKEYDLLKFIAEKASIILPETDFFDKVV